MFTESTMTRRTALKVAGLGLTAGLALPRTLHALLQDEAPGVTVFDWTAVGSRAHVAFGRGGNALVVASGNAALLVDCKNAGFGKSLFNEARGNAAPLAIAVNTHHHADHTGGNAAFSGAVRLIAHAKAEPRIISQFDRYIEQMGSVRDMVRESNEEWAEKMRADTSSFFGSIDQLDASDFGPTETFDGGQRDVRIGDIQVELVHVGPGHTDNDVFVHVPAMNIIHAGDLLFHRMHPFIDRGAGATTDGWIESLNAMIERCNDKTIVVPGHGEVTDVSGLHLQAEYFRKSRAAIESAIAEGKDRDAITGMTFDHFDGYGFEQIRGRSIGAIYDEIMESR